MYYVEVFKKKNIICRNIFILKTFFPLVAEEEAEKEAESKERKLLDKEVVKVKKETRETSPPSGHFLFQYFIL